MKIILINARDHRVESFHVDPLTFVHGVQEVLDGTFEIGATLSNGDILLVNEELCVRPDVPDYGFNLEGRRFFGNAVVVGSNKDRYAVPARSGLRTLSRSVKFICLKKIFLSDLF